MRAVPVAERMTAEEFLALPESDGAWARSLVDGEVVVNDPTMLHGTVVTDLLVAIEIWARAHDGRGQASVPVDVALDERNVYKPDILWYAEGRAPARLDPRPYAMPDLAVEVRSPSTWRYDLGAKKHGYERHGLPELWLVDTAAETVIVYRRSQPKASTFDVSLELTRDEQLTSPLLPGFSLSLTDLFPH